MSVTAPERAPLMTVRDIQRETQLSRSYIYQLIERGELPAIRIARVVRVRREDLDLFLESRRGGFGDTN